MTATSLDAMDDAALFARLREDHWSMAVLFQRLSEGLADRLDQQVLRRILAVLVAFFIEHSRREELYLDRIAHPARQRHRDEHEAAIREMRAILAGCEGGQPLQPADLAAISALFTDILFVADRRDGLPAPGERR